MTSTEGVRRFFFQKAEEVGTLSKGGLGANADRGGVKKNPEILQMLYVHRP